MYSPEFNLLMETAIHDMKERTEHFVNLLGEDHPVVKVFEAFDECFEVIDQSRQNYDECFDPVEKEEIRQETLNMLHKLNFHYRKAIARVYADSCK